jgi:hypothetical protein
VRTDEKFVKLGKEEQMKDPRVLGVRLVVGIVTGFFGQKDLSDDVADRAPLSKFGSGLEDRVLSEALRRRVSISDRDDGAVGDGDEEGEILEVDDGGGSMMDVEVEEGIPKGGLDEDDEDDDEEGAL